MDREEADEDTPGEPWRPLHAYRCYLHGPDGIHALRPHGPGAQRRYGGPLTGSIDAHQKAAEQVQQVAQRAVRGRWRQTLPECRSLPDRHPAAT